MPRDSMATVLSRERRRVAGGRRQTAEDERRPTLWSGVTVVQATCRVSAAITIPRGVKASRRSDVCAGSTAGSQVPRSACPWPGCCRAPLPFCRDRLTRRPTRVSTAWRVVCRAGDSAPCSWGRPSPACSCPRLGCPARCSCRPPPEKCPSFVCHMARASASGRSPRA